MGQMISDTELDILIQSYQAIGTSRSINQNWVLDSLLELKKYRKAADKIIDHMAQKVGLNGVKALLVEYDVPR